MEKNRSGFLWYGPFAFVLLLIAALGLGSCSLWSRPKGILFIGHYYFHSNDMPDIFQSIALGEKKKVAVLNTSLANYPISRHLTDNQTQRHLREKKWDTVIFTDIVSGIMDDGQLEAEIIPSWVEFKRQLDSLGIDGRYVMINWAYRSGMASTVNYRTFETMQAKLTANTVKAAASTGIPSIPVGNAWMEFHSRYPDFALWTADGSHPSPTGSYLAACVIYCTLFGEPITNTENLPPWLDGGLAREIREIAYTASTGG